MDLYEVVTKLIGPICPVGESHTDEFRLRNLKTMTNLVDKLLFDIAEVSRYAGRAEHSMKQAGQFAADFLEEIKEA